MNLGDICTREVILADRAATLQQAANLMREHHVGMLVIAGNSDAGLQVLGLVTDRDIVVEAVARGLDTTQTEVGRLASEKLAALPASAAIDEAITAMKARGVRRLLVSGESGQLHGVLSLDDLLGALGHEMAELAHAVRKGVERETAERAPLPSPPPPPRPLHIPAYAFA